MTYALRIFTLVAMVSALCLVTGCLERPNPSVGRERDRDGGSGGGGGGESFNLFNPQGGSNQPRRVIPRPVNTRSDPVTEGLRQAGDPEGRREFNSRVLPLYGAFFAGLTILIGGWYYWKVWKQKRAEWELNDPVALLKELNFVHQLSDQERQLMQELSDENSLSSPLKLFIEPKFLLEALKSDAFAAAQPSVRQLLSKLFDITPEGNDMSGVAGMGTETIATV